MTWCKWEEKKYARHVDDHRKQSCVFSVYRAHVIDMHEKFISFWSEKYLVNFWEHSQFFIFLNTHNAALNIEM